MTSNQNATEEYTDDEFDLQTNTAINIETVQQRLKEFSYYLVENIEFNLNFCLHLLEERPVPTRPTSIHVTALSLLCSAIPNLPGWVGSALKTGETTIFRKIEKKNSRILADLVYYFSDNKLAFRETIIDAATEVFGSFETQFMKLSCKGGEKRAMQKLAIDASDRIFNYFLITEQSREMTKTEIINGIISGDSKRNKKGFKEGKQVLHDETKWKTCKLYSKVGIVITDSEKHLFYKTIKTNPKKYGYRKLFSCENQDEIIKNWILDNHFEILSFHVEITDELKLMVKDYIMTKNPHEDAKLEMRKQNEEAKQDREIKHEELLKILKRHFTEFFDGMNKLVEKLSANNEEAKTLLETVTKNQEEESKKQDAMITKLDEVHVDVKETKQTQEILVTKTKNIHNEVVEIKTNQEELAVAVVKHDQIKDIIKSNVNECTKEDIKENIKEIFSETLTAELERSIPRVEAELKRCEEKLRSFF